MAETSPSVALIGCTGLVGSHILSTLLDLPSIAAVHAIARRDLPRTSDSLVPHINSDTATWPAILKKISPPPSMFLSALGTTRAAAGSFAAQYAIEHGLNLDLARAARDSGVQVYVLISSGAASKSSSFPYLKMKGEIEEAIQEVGFPHTVIVRPGMLVGSRQESRPAETVLRTIAKGLGSISKHWLMDWWAQDSDVVARAAVQAGLQCIEGKRPEGVWVIEQAEMIRLGQKET